MNTNIVKSVKKAGNFNFDFANLDRFVELCFKYGIKKEINLFEFAETGTVRILSLLCRIILILYEFLTMTKMKDVMIL